MLPAAKRTRTLLLSTRLLVGLVMLSNLSAAVVYLAAPGNYTAAFELQGEPGVAAVAGMGILFVMWQVPYLFAIIDPIRFRASLLEAVLMQALGLTGESLLLSQISTAHAQLRGSIQRFILFDLAGLAVLVLALALNQRTLKLWKEGQHA